jgi:hypothetical protein
MTAGARQLAAVGLAALAVSCSTGASPVVLDGSPRIPDAEGVVVAVTARRLTLDHGRSWPLSRSLQSFSTYTLQTLPVTQHAGRYVQVGLADGAVVWVAAIGAVITVPVPTVVYVGVLRIVDGRRAVFADGTVLALAPHAQTSVVRGPARAEIDPERHRVTRLSPA